ncbi:MAG: hypothetical protein NWE92_03005 [Candidatus Bathyarchaeota archaeon]|nr:hypothetical protein [Candidatus Bathyarchaeota archaeon]
MQTPICNIAALKWKRLNMNRENYKVDRKKPKQNNAVSRSKRQMLATPKITNSAATPKLREIYSSKTEWATKVLPKIKEQ